MKTLKTNVDVLEMMIFYWESVASKDKMADDYFIAVADKPQMDVLYCDDFSKDSVRKVLSAISNREKLSESTQKERRFWNNNMWILEDLSVMQNMMAPIKTLNLSELAAKHSSISKFEEAEVIFIPGHEEEFYSKDNKLYINFFKLIPNFQDPTDIKIAGKELKSYIEDWLVK